MASPSRLLLRRPPAATLTRSYTTTLPSYRPKTTEELSVTGGPRASHVAMPRSVPEAPQDQAPNRLGIWSKNQNPRSNAMRGARFEQTNFELQPTPLAAVELIAEEPIRLVPARVAACDGGGGALGHPRVFINLDKPGPKACGYCGIRFEREVHHH